MEPVLEEHLSREALHFVVTNHDDILNIVSRRPSRFGVTEDETKATMVGLKLLSEVVLEHRTREPFSERRQALREFTLRVKGEQDS